MSCLGIQGWLFNGRLALMHHRNQVLHVFYDLVNEQQHCETCVCVLGGGGCGVCGGSGGGGGGGASV